jgi:hypothetical protein
MRLDLSKPVQKQIIEAKKAGTPLVFDLRQDRMGDKAAFTSIIAWLAGLYGPITILESVNGKTAFMLADYFDGAECAILDPLEDHKGLDLCTTGLELACNWELHAYLASIGIRPRLSIEVPVEYPSDYIVFAVKSGALYDERKDMDLYRSRETIDQLRMEGHEVEVLYDREDSLFPDAKPRTMEQCLELIAQCRAFVGGDTGFSHVAAACGVPQVAIYPDYFKFGKASLSKSLAISEWWGLKGLLWTPFNTLPNSDNFAVVELGTDHKWSIEHVLKALERLGVRSVDRELT